MRNLEKFTKITEKEANELEAQEVAMLFDLPSCSCGGFFEAKPNGKHDVILCIFDEGYFIRAREDLVKSNDEVFIGFCEEGKPPEFEDVFEVREL